MENVERVCMALAYSGVEATVPRVVQALLSLDASKSTMILTIDYSTRTSGRVSLGSST